MLLWMEEDVNFFVLWRQRSCFKNQIPAPDVMMGVQTISEELGWAHT